MSALMLTGGQGYIGSVLVNSIPDDMLIVDMGYFAEQPAGQDIRDITGIQPGVFEAIIHLAGLSNDPLGELDEALTFDINHHATVRLARMAKEAGVKRFIFASTQSIYGIASGDDYLTEDAPKNPITAYAKSKWLTEQEVLAMASEDFCVVALRAATVFGWSPRFRSDIVFNNLLASAFTTGRIDVRSDGSPWRPVVHIQDLCDAYVACLKCPPHLINGRAFNVGLKNYTVLELADIVKELAPEAKVTFGAESADERTYRTDGTRIHSVLGELLPQRSRGIRAEGQNMLEQFARIGLTEAQFRGPETNRLARLKALIADGKLDAELRWR